MIKRTTQIKTALEIKILKRSAKIAVKIFNAIKEEIFPGRTEKNIRSLINDRIKSMGLRTSFPTIVACGSNCSNPHAVSGDRVIKKDDMVMIDFGVIYKGMHSDFTRTICLGNPKQKLKELYKAVDSAQKWSIKHIKGSIKISDHVRAVNDILRKKGFGKYIKHTLGHGVGSRIHEAPKLSQRNNQMLKENMVVTIEPGLYVKGLGGVRIEDMVIIKKKGSEVITK
jgi:Xaa-Pro aminopeptidase